MTKEKHNLKMQNAIARTKNQQIKHFRLKAAEMLLEACSYDLASVMNSITKAYGHNKHEAAEVAK